ncbi:hypothetical protein FCT18_14820 [Lysinibacillus sphaericus]|uniref:Uncharacterized protein n=1 Tax=Lysinibacillus sphaericus TaxID=1421 RepID=A0A2S0K638_LYSSH|nr:hypothetical protein [Lysinibacillus sphaericus]AVK98831.1 hypothetical protein LS41612_22345 [Lysinibacillus sphaericus]MED4545308.1 hypothetical protein [Lysinibacillus sphaericus]TKI18367.1 hypothetical protein FCT18_14820 [Lysinibacillus sphaericus]SUV15153.1 Uncharacterised protein [Lysinibacillus sphaericus]
MDVLKVATKTLQLAIKTAIEGVRGVVDGINIKQNELAQSVENVNANVGRMDSPFEVGKLLPFQIAQYVQGIGDLKWISVYKVSGAGLLDLAISYTSYGSGISIVVDGVTLVKTPALLPSVQGVSPSGEYLSPSGTSMVTHINSSSLAAVVTNSGTYAPDTSSGIGMLWINRPIKFKNSLEIFVTGATSQQVSYRIQGGIFV